MAHEIHENNAVFSALEGKGWHGLGLPIPEDIANDPRKIAELCGATYAVEKRECFFKNSAGELVKAPGREVIVRADTDAMLSIASDTRYHVENRQPVDMFESFRDQLANEGLIISHAAVLRGGADICVCAMLPSEFDISVAQGDVLHSYITASTGYNGHSTKVMKGTIRVVCQNTLMAAVQQAMKAGRINSIRASQLLEKDSISDMIANVKTLVDAERTVFDSLANTKMSDADVTRFFADVLEVNIADLGKEDKQGKKLVSTKTENILKQLAASYVNAPGASSASGTAWGALNSVTYFATHLKGIRDTSGSGENAARVASNLNGDAAKLKLRALELAASYAGKVAIAA